MALGTLLSRVTGLGRVVVLAYVLGATRLADSYNLANNTPNMIFDLVLGGVLSATLVPVFVERLTTRDDEEASRAVSAVLTLAGAVLGAASVATVAGAPWIIRLYNALNHTGAARDEQAVATVFLALFAPQVAFYGFAALAEAVLNARRRFAAPKFAPVLNNVVTMAVLLLARSEVRGMSLHDARHRTGLLLLLGLGTTAGVAVQALALVPAVRGAGLSLRWLWQPGHEAVRRVVRLSGWTAGFVVANQAALVVVLVLANQAAGGVSKYQYAYLFFQLPYGIVAVSLMSALQPELAERWSRQDRAGFRRQLAEGLRLVTAVIVPAAAGMVLLARPLIGVALQHGHLDPQAARTTAAVVAWFAVGLPGFSVFLLLVRAYQSIQDTRTAFWLYLLENGLNVAFAVALYPPYGVRGLAASLAAAYTIAAVVAAADLRRRIGGLEGERLLGVWARVAGATAAMAAVVALVVARVGSAHGAGQLTRAAVGVVAGVTVYAISARLLGVDEVTALVNLNLRRRGA
jgi:putative peptidoglycan lipid II flippase